MTYRLVDSSRYLLVKWFQQRLMCRLYKWIQLAHYSHMLTFVGDGLHWHMSPINVSVTGIYGRQKFLSLSWKRARLGLHQPSHATKAGFWRWQLSFFLELPTHWSEWNWTLKCILCNNRSMPNFIQIGRHMGVILWRNIWLNKNWQCEHLWSYDCMALYKFDYYYWW